MHADIRTRYQITLSEPDIRTRMSNRKCMQDFQSFEKKKNIFFFFSHDKIQIDRNTKFNFSASRI